MSGGAHRLEADVTAVETEVSALARAVALKRAAITGVATTLLTVAVAMGWVSPDLSAHATGLVEGGLTLAGVLGAGAWIHRGTTPADQALQPRNSAGQPLVPDTSMTDALGLDEGSPELAAALETEPNTGGQA